MTVTKILEQTLSAGATSVSFTDVDIPNSLIRVYSSNSDLIPVSRILSGNTLTVTYEAQSNAIDVAVEIVKAGLDIVDNLTSTDTDKALSAKQGKIVKDAVDALNTTVNNLDIPDNITDLDDVNVTSIEDGQVLVWDEDASKFVNVTPSAGSSSIDYRLIEKKVGTWLDENTDLYECTFVSTPTASSYTIDVSSLNIDKLIKRTGCFTRTIASDNIQQKDIEYRTETPTNNNYGILLELRNNLINIGIVGYTYTEITEIRFVIQYTKKS